MQDLDSAVGRLDNILMSVYVIVAILIVAIALVANICIFSFAPVLIASQEAQLVTLVTGAGTLILGTHNPTRLSTFLDLPQFRSKLAHRWKLARSPDKYHILIH